LRRGTASLSVRRVERPFIPVVCEAVMSETRKVLVVDDDEKIGDLICNYLGKCRFEAHSVGDGLDAIEFLKKREEHIDIIITDYSMPQMNGLELTKVVRLRYPRTVVIGMSGFEAMASDFRKAGAHAFFRKPFQLPDVLSAINSVIL
jgi:DNA-binding NtrC family response regulator